MTVRLAIDPPDGTTGGTTGWHIHPGWTFAIVESGDVKLTRFGRRGCQSETFLGAGGFFEATNEVHTADNLSDQEPVVLLVTFVLRSEGLILPNDLLIPVDPPDCD